MKIVFSGLEKSIEISKESVSVLQVENHVLFARLCQSLLQGKEERAIEPYTLWDDEGNRVKAHDGLMIIVDPFQLPFRHKALMGSLYKKIAYELLIEEDVRSRLQDLSSEMNACVNEIARSFNGDYEFTLEWGVENYLKAFGFDVEASDDQMLLDNLIRFLELAADMAYGGTLVFVNLRTFLSKNEIEELNRSIIFHRIKVLMLENTDSSIYDEFDSKRVVDQHFIEFDSSYQSECTSSSQGRICSNGFGAVAF